jgi:uncharacterized protein
MPHLRDRYIEPRIKEALAYSPIVGLLGQRQVGKTTLLDKWVQERVTLDRERFLLMAEADPEAFLQGRAIPFGIDEAQLCPRLFPALKEHVYSHKTPGQFLLTGSVRFTGRKAVRESLTGRIVNLEVIPFSIRESHKLPLSKSLKILSQIETGAQLHKMANNATRSPVTLSMVEHFLEVGGLPGLCFLRNREAILEKFESQLDTILNRDIRLIYPTTLLYPNLRRLLKFIANHQGRIFSLKAAAEEAQISTVSLPKILFAFEALFLIRPIEVLGVRKTVYFLEDQGMASWLTGSKINIYWDLVRAAYSNLREQIVYGKGEVQSVSQWRTRNGAEVPLVFQVGSKQIGLLPVLEKTPSPKVIGSAKAFLKANLGSKAFILHLGSEVREVVPSRLFFIPFTLVI